jgi:hypothetical protein
LPRAARLCLIRGSCTLPQQPQQKKVIIYRQEWLWILIPYLYNTLFTATKCETSFEVSPYALNSKE